MWKPIRSWMRGPPEVRLAVFGKHPGWDDHIPDLGLDSRCLNEIKRILYRDGIGGNISSGRWEASAAGHGLKALHHAFGWRRGERWILGRLWSSADGKGRCQYPMVVCAEGDGVALPAARAAVLEQLRQIESGCRKATSSEMVLRVLRDAAARIRDRMPTCGPTDSGGLDVLETLRAHPDSGEHGLTTLLRMLDGFRAGNGGNRITRVEGPSALHLRVPRCAKSVNTALDLWDTLLSRYVGPEVSIWKLAPLGKHRWIDLMLGTPTPEQLACLRQTTTALPLSVSRDEPDVELRQSA